HFVQKKFKSCQFDPCQDLTVIARHFQSLHFYGFPSGIQGANCQGSSYLQTPFKRTYSTCTSSFTSLLISSRNSISEYGSIFKTRPRTSRMQYSGSTLFIDISQSVSRAMI